MEESRSTHAIIEDAQSDLLDRIARVRGAIENPGPRPDLHRAQLEQLQSECPTLWSAIECLFDEPLRIP